MKIMNQLKLIAVLFIIFPVIAFAQTGPHFLVDGGESIQTGTHMRGKEVHYEIRFKNDGDSDLKIVSVSTSCGCSTALASDSIIQPGGSGTINFTFNGNGMGQVAKGVNVYTNEAEGKNVHTMVVSMNMVDPVTINPQSIITEGKVGDELTQTATLTNFYDKPIVISEVTSNSPAVKVTSDKTTIDLRETATITISIKIYEESAVNAAAIIRTDAGEFEIPILVDVKAK
jgi:hypothetical protein